MKDKKVFNGIKALYNAEILAVIALAVEALANLVGVLLNNGMIAVSDIMNALIRILTSVFLVIAILLLLSSYAAILVGTLKAAKGDSIFKYALIESAFLIVTNITSVGLFWLQTYKIPVLIMGNISVVAELFMILFVIFGVTHSSEIPCDENIKESGRRLTYFLIPLFSIKIIYSLISELLANSNVLQEQELNSLLDNIIIGLPVAIMYLRYLNQVKEMMDDNINKQRYSLSKATFNNL